ncbi:hypothetical protein, partial [Methylobacterium sp. WL103]|uniref:hypothetical protein n=1 Tax=Methylobacterium sp. WL103 TaxID=2603891 RepID=UPI001AED9307
PRGGGRRLDAGMAAADDDDIESLWKRFGHPRDVPPPREKVNHPPLTGAPPSGACLPREQSARVLGIFDYIFKVTIKCRTVVFNPDTADRPASE